MKKLLILGLAILPFAGLLLMTCPGVHTSEFKISLTMTVDKTEASIGDTVTATVVCKNTNYNSIKIELPNWVTNRGGKSREDILFAIFTTKEDISWPDELASYDNTVVKRPKFILEKDEVIKRTFTHTITEAEDFYVHAAAFFFLFYDEIHDQPHEDRDYYGTKGFGFPKPIKINVQQGEQ